MIESYLDIKIRTRRTCRERKLLILSKGEHNGSKIKRVILDPHFKPTFPKTTDPFLNSIGQRFFGNGWKSEFCKISNHECVSLNELENTIFDCLLLL